MQKHEHIKDIRLCQEKGGSCYQLINNPQTLALCSSGKREVVIIAHAPNGSLTFVSIPREVQSHKPK